MYKAPTPAVADGRLYARTGPGELTAYDLATRRRLWTAQSADELPTEDFQVSNVLALGDLVVFGAHQRLTAVDARTGDRRWVWTPSLGGAVGYNFPVRAHGTTIYVGTRVFGNLYAVDARTGQERWAVQVVGATRDPRAPQSAEGPAADDRHVVVGFRVALERADSGGVACYDALTGAERWRFLFPPSELEPYAASQGDVVLVGDVAVVSDVSAGRVFGLALEDGRLLWTAPAIQVPDYRRLAATGGVVAVGSARGRVVGLDPSTGQERWRASLTRDASVLDFMTAADGAFYVAAFGGEITVLDARTGAVRWKYERVRRSAERESFWGPVTVTPDLVLATTMEALYALRK